MGKKLKKLGLSGLLLLNSHADSALGIKNYQGRHASLASPPATPASAHAAAPTLVPTYKSWAPHASPCWSDGTAGPYGGIRSLEWYAFDVSADNMTVEACLDTCGALGFALAGLEYSRECFCGNTIMGTGAPVNASSCNLGCTGSKDSLCGGNLALNLYVQNNSSFTRGPASILSSYNCFGNPQCLSDSDAHSRVLPNQPPQVPAHSNNMTVQVCVNACVDAGYIYAGLEYGKNCWCSSKPPSTNVSLATNCNERPCSGDGSQHCGGSRAIIVYTRTPGVSCAAPSSTTSPATSPTSSTSPTTSPASSTSPISSTSHTSSPSPTSTPSSSTSPSTSQASSSSSTLGTTTTSSLTPGPTNIGCPTGQGQTYTAKNGKQFIVECSLDRPGNTFAKTTSDSFASALEYCSVTPGCVNLAYTFTSGATSLRNNTVATQVNPLIYGARLISSYVH